VLATAESQYPVSSPQAGWMEQQPEAWVTAAQEVLAGFRTGALEILGIGFSGQMHGLVCLDDSDAVIRPAILWNDQRSAPQCAALEAGTGRDRLLRLTGNRALPGFTAPKLLWMRENEPAAFARIRRICLPKDYVRDHFVGGHRSDVADASGTLLLDVGERRWSSELLAELQIPPSWLPELAESPDAVGELDGVPVAAGAGDQAAAAVGYAFDAEYFNHLARDYRLRRDLIMQSLSAAGFKFTIPEGAYYILADFSELSDLGDVDFATWLTREGGVATVPGSSFYHDRLNTSRYIRFAFCKKRETLEAAAERLANLKALV